MSDVAVALPQPSPEDDEDVVWGLSTASALWARGEHRDAIVWLRRAAEAATAAGQDFRASQLGMCASEIEDAIGPEPAVAAKPASLPAPPPAVPASAPPAPPPPPPKPSATPPAPRSAAPPPPPPPPPDATATLVAPLAPPVPDATAASAKRESPWSRTLPVAPGTVPPAAPTPRVDVVLATPPPANADTPPPPPPPLPAAQPAPAPPSATPPAPAPSSPVSIATPSDPQGATRSRRARARQPILDPWSEPAAVASPVAAKPPPPAPARSTGGDYVVEVRSRATMDSDEDVVTSAAPLETVSRRPATAASSRGAPPPPPPRATKAATPEVPTAEAATPPPAAAPVAPAPAPERPAPDAAPALAAPPPHEAEPPPGSLAGSGLVVPAKKLGALAPLPPPEPLDFPPEQRSVGGVLLEEIAALADLPHDAQSALAAAARVEQLGADEEVSAFGAVLVIDGAANVCARLVDVAAARAVARTIVPARGSQSDGVALRVVAGEGGARLAVWQEAVFAETLKSFPWVLDEIREVADRLQALAGSTMGPLGDLDEGSRTSTMDRLTVRKLGPGEVLLERGSATPGIMVVGVGTIELVGESGATRELTGGDLVFPSAALDGRATAATARAAGEGALVLVADRKATQALFAEHPQLVELFSSD